jgi:hypothetical protein
MKFLNKFFILILLAFVNIEVNSMNSDRSKSVNPDEREFHILKDYFKKNGVDINLYREKSVPDFKKHIKRSNLVPKNGVNSEEN